MAQLSRIYLCALHSDSSFCLVAPTKSGLALDYPYITALLPNGVVEIHSIETQVIAQVLSAPPGSPRNSTDDDPHERRRLQLVSSVGGYLVPSSQRSDRMRLQKVTLGRIQSGQINAIVSTLDIQSNNIAIIQV